MIISLTAEVAENAEGRRELAAKGREGTQREKMNRTQIYTDER